tara:strand:+ start:711 stop:920 length:210 start_codon:yes stop_codon:yes gene_type:complete
VITFLETLLKIHLFTALLTIYQLVYAVNTVTYKEKPTKNKVFKKKRGGGEGHWGVWGYVYMYIYTEVVF